LKKKLQQKTVEATKHKEGMRANPKLDEQEGVPQRQHCPLEKRHGDMNP
jgi:hypothetical protein